MSEGLTRRLVPTTSASGALPIVTPSNNLLLGSSRRSSSGRRHRADTTTRQSSSSSSSPPFEQEDLKEKDDDLMETTRRQSKWRTVLGHNITLLSPCVRNRSCSVTTSATTNRMRRCCSCTFIAGDDCSDDEEESSSSSWEPTRGGTCKRFCPNNSLSFFHFLFPSSSTVVHHYFNLSYPTMPRDENRPEYTSPTTVPQNTSKSQSPAMEISARTATITSLIPEPVAVAEQTDAIEDEDGNKRLTSTDEADNTVPTEASLFLMNGLNSTAPKKKEPSTSAPSPASPCSKDEAQNQKGLPDYRYCKVDLPSSKPGLDVVFVDLCEDDSESTGNDEDFISEIRGTKSETSKTTPSSPQVRFYLRFPNHNMNAAAQQQAKLERAKRAERTADFVELAKALSLRLTRDSWSRRRRLSSGGGGSSSSNSSLRQQIQRSRSSSSSTTPATTLPIGATRRMSGDGGGRGLTTRSSQLRRNSIGTMPLGRNSNDDGNSGYDLRHMAQSLQSSSSQTLSIEESGMEGCRKINRQQDLNSMSPKSKRRSSGFGALSSKSSISRQNSSDSLHLLLEHEMMLRKSPLCNPMMGPNQNFTGEQGEYHKDDDVLLRESLGYVDLDVPLKNEGGATQPYMPSRRSSLSSVHTSSASSCLGYEEGEGPQPVRPTRYRAERRASFVAGSKIERYDDNGGNKKKKSRRRGSLHGPNAGAYTEWQLEMMGSG